ncbi:MAG TPA: hypothetical protein VHO06_14985 [Polyangia bacterium]|nr:hypothetical protein [Polyangia bacterium]
MPTTLTTRRAIRPPSGFEDHLCRREAAALLGFASEFKVRQLEREGRLHPIRGAMGSAWYPRAEVEALRAAAPRALSIPSAPRLRWPDDALLALLRERPRTVVDLVIDAGIPISRAERVYRFWRTHEAHARLPPAAPERPPPPEAPGAERDRTSAERRSGERIEHDALLLQLRDADPKIRAAAFERLRSQRR